MSIKKIPSGKNCIACGVETIYTSMKSPFIDDHVTFCENQDCIMCMSGESFLNDQARSQATHDISRDRSEEKYDDDFECGDSNE